MDERSISYAFFVGDVHLDDRNPMREKAFCEFLDMVRSEKPDHVFLMGDIFEFWFGYRNVMFSRVLKPVIKIAQLSDAGIPVTYLVGNHDFKPGPVFRDILGVRIEYHPVRVTLGSQYVYLAHGDEINADDIGYRFIRAVFRHPVSQWLFQHFIPASLAWYIGRGTSDSSRKLNGRRERFIPEKAFDAFCRRELSREVNTVIHGHTHDPGIRSRETGGKSLRIIDSGDWLGEQGHYVVFRNDEFQCKTWPF
ncbi:UDP-2,3-diacylglucosamine diphosphatase [bacterium]|nr:UDP-2,3-diacylglucosamine diphosphatase [candidate division CSSED10-310 bacterium]